MTDVETISKKLNELEVKLSNIKDSIILELENELKTKSEKITRQDSLLEEYKKINNKLSNELVQVKTYHRLAINKYYDLQKKYKKLKEKMEEEDIDIDLL